MIRPYHDTDKEEVVTMISSLRVFLAKLKSIERKLDLEAAAEELELYLGNNFSVFVAESPNGLAGYLVCRIDNDVVWAESIFVHPDYRRQGIASSLYIEAERLAQELGGDTVFNWVHPNNNVSISFLKKRGLGTVAENPDKVRHLLDGYRIKGLSSCRTLYTSKKNH